MPTQKRFTEEETRERKNARQREYAKRTGYAANIKYNKENISRIIVAMKKEKVDEYKKKCDSMGISYMEIPKKAIEAFMSEEDIDKK